MKKSSKILATALMVSGVLVMLLALVSCGFNFGKLDTSDGETSTYEIKEEFSNISVDIDTEDLIVDLTDGEYAVVVCENEKTAISHSVSVNNGTLEIRTVDERKWYDHVNLFSFEKSKIKISLPAGEYGDLTISADTSDICIAKDFDFKSVDISLSTGDTKCYASASDFIKINASTGDIDVSGVDTGELELSASTGHIGVSGCTADSATMRTSTGKINVSYLTVNNALSVSVTTGDVKIANATCGSLTTTGNTGDIKFENVIVAELMSIKRSTGDVELLCCDAGEIAIDTGTGDVKASLLTDKIFIVRTDTGKINAPETTSGGKCKITTDTGNITVTIKN